MVESLGPSPSPMGEYFGSSPSSMADDLCEDPSQRGEYFGSILSSMANYLCSGLGGGGLGAVTPMYGFESDVMNITRKDI
jgi:hypothetical protein